MNAATRCADVSHPRFGSLYSSVCQPDRVQPVPVVRKALGYLEALHGLKTDFLRVFQILLCFYIKCRQSQNGACFRPFPTSGRIRSVIGFPAKGWTQNKRGPPQISWNHINPELLQRGEIVRCQPSFSAGWHFEDSCCTYPDFQVHQ